MKIFFFSLFFLLGAVAQESPQLPVHGVDAARCDVRISYGSSGSSRCFFNEVMIGIDSVDPLRIRCGRVDVTCPNFSTGEPAEDRDAKTADTEGFEF